jgi:UDP-N-acetylmuramoyl-L-alanyl-D-glutamate--2,6-diaminopimelate ligase
MVSKIFEEQGEPVAAVGSLGFKIKERTWPNTLKMTLPGRLKLQGFLYRVKKAGCKYVVLEATSEGIAQNRLAGVNIGCAVFTNLHREHLESHGSFENYLAAKQKLFLKTRNRHILNIDDPYFEKFANYPARNKITYGKQWGLISPLRPPISDLRLRLLGDFNEYNALAALAVADGYGLDLKKAVETLNSIESIPGRMEVIRSEKGFDVVVDYAHTPDSLKLVYQTLRSQLPTKLICILGAAGGGRDKWKRPEFGKIAAGYCDQIILTNEDPYDENPLSILEQIESGFSQIQMSKSKIQKIIDRREAIKQALTLASQGDIVAITGKGSETSIAVAGGRKIPWSDKAVVEELLK